MLKSNQIAAMLEFQASMNAKVNPAWLNAGYPFLRAVVIEGAEGAEGMEHHGWKWWKAQKLDLPQLQMELVDIWHFALSHFVIRAEGNLEKASGAIQENATATEILKFDGQDFDTKKLDIVSKIELVIGLATVRRFSIPLFAALLADCVMTWDDLYRQYVSKNVLNFFRQDHGYKEGSYIKVWQGREDNEHLVDIAAAIDAASPDYRDQLYAGLKSRYASITA